MGLPINPSAWQSALSDLTQQLVEANADLVEWSWTNGGCFAFAAAFSKVFGGELYGVCKPETTEGYTDYPVGHALVKLNGVFYDYNGVFDTAAVAAPEVIKAKSDDDVAWFDDYFLDEQQTKKLRQILKSCRTQKPAKGTSEM